MLTLKDAMRSQVKDALDAEFAPARKSSTGIDKAIKLYKLPTRGRRNHTATKAELDSESDSETLMALEIAREKKREADFNQTLRMREKQMQDLEKELQGM